MIRAAQERRTQEIQRDGACSERAEPSPVGRVGNSGPGTWRGQSDGGDFRLGASTIYQGLSDIRDRVSAPAGRVREEGGGRKKRAVEDPTLAAVNLTRHGFHGESHTICPNRKPGIPILPTMACQVNTLPLQFICGCCPSPTARRPIRSLPSPGWIFRRQRKAGAIADHGGTHVSVAR
jgi:hypothetical protein